MLELCLALATVRAQAGREFRALVIEQWAIIRTGSGDAERLGIRDTTLR
jgi:hypothetical protein